MATDGPDPKACNKKLYYDGFAVHISETYGANHFEKLVKQVAKETKCEVDWHYFAGRAVVKCWPQDKDKIHDAISRIIVPEIERKRAEFFESMDTLDSQKLRSKEDE
jgi:hypothetical protein